MTDLMYWLGVVAVAAPAAMTAGLGVTLLLGVRPSEGVTHRLLQAGVTVGLLAAVGVFVGMLATGNRDVLIDLGEWAHVPPHYHFNLEFLFDRLSVPFAVLTFVLCGTVGAFATRYMHREPGYQRFFFLFAVFTLGMVTAAVAGSVETLFAGWELVGLSSVLLIGFFHERPAPVRNGFRVWVIYRASDAALLLAAVLTHRLVHTGDFHHLIGAGEWPYEVPVVSAWQATLVGGLLLFAAAGKSALLPFSGWLPRAMEGPTPSSAVFYGALSVHLGAFLLLRVSPLFAVSTPLAVAAVLLGLGTAVVAAVVGRVQTDIKSVLSFASLTQVGVIVAEIGAGHWVPFLWWVALVHMLGHACFRTLQFLRAPSLLQDYRNTENAIGDKLPRANGGPPSAFRLGLYRFALERGYLDAILSEYVARPFVAVFRILTTWERRWTDWLNGAATESSPVPGEGTAGREELTPLSSPHPHPATANETPLEVRR